MLPNIISSQLRLHFPSYADLSDEVKDTLVCVVLLYLFRGSTSVGMTASLKQHLGAHISVLAFRQSILGTGYLLRNVKGYLYTLSSRKAFTRKEALPVSVAFHIREEDVILGKYIKVCSGLQTLLSDYNEKGYRCLTLPYFSRALDQIAVDTHAYTSKFVYRKLRFIYQSNGMDIADFTNDFIAKGIQSILVMYPCVDGRLHALNIAKQAIHNHGINTILRYTSKGRQTLQQGNDGCFSSRKVSLDLLHSARISNEGSFFANGLDGRVVLMGEHGKFHDKQDLEISIAQLLLQASPKQRKAIRLFMGDYCPMFSQWLQTERNIKMNNVDYYNRLSSRNLMHLFMNNAFDFLEVDQHRGYAFIEKLKLALA